MNDTDEKRVEELFGGGVKPANTREKLVFTAIHLFHEHGFHAVGLDYILAEAKLTKSTFYNHFESRDALALEAVKLRDKWEMEAFNNAVQKKAGYDPKAMLLAMFDVLDDWFNHPDYLGCIFIAACSEFPSKDNPIKCAASKHYADAGEGIQKMAKAIGIVETEAFAEEWVMLLEGAITYRQVTDSNGAALIARRTAAARLEDYLSRS
jgi:AcrR family transcriptional regulator